MVGTRFVWSVNHGLKIGSHCGSSPQLVSKPGLRESLLEEVAHAMIRGFDHTDAVRREGVDRLLQRLVVLEVRCLSDVQDVRSRALQVARDDVLRMDRIHQVDLGLVLYRWRGLRRGSILFHAGRTMLLKISVAFLLVGHRHRLDVLAVGDVVQAEKAAARRRPELAGLQLDLEVPLAGRELPVDAGVSFLLLTPRPKRLPAALVGLEPE